MSHESIMNQLIPLMIVHRAGNVYGGKDGYIFFKLLSRNISLILNFKYKLHFTFRLSVKFDNKFLHGKYRILCFLIFPWTFKKKKRKKKKKKSLYLNSFKHFLCTCISHNDSEISNVTPKNVILRVKLIPSCSITCSPWVMTQQLFLLLKCIATVNINHSFSGCN